MKAMSWAGIVAIAAMLAAAGAARAHGGASHEADQAASRPVTGNSRWGANYFPNVPLTTQDGKTVRFYDDLIKGKSVAINFMYTECTEVCPLETASLVRAYKFLGERAGRDVVFYSISMDPKRDTPAVLKAYAAKFGADWLFLTGKPDDIRLLGKKLGMLRERDEATSSHHAAQLLLGDEPNGQWQRNSAVDNPEFLTARMATFFGWRDVAPAKSYADARPVVAPNGQRLFQSKCSSCHTFGQGDRVGPDLAGITARRTRAWVTRYIAEPDALLAAGDPIATELFKRYKEVRMPNLRLGSSDVADLVSFLNAQDVSTSGRAPHATPAARPDGSARR
jgi:protein SCO1/2